MGNLTPYRDNYLVGLQKVSINLSGTRLKEIVIKIKRINSILEKIRIDENRRNIWGVLIKR
jgi:hypothetical protein